MIYGYARVSTSGQARDGNSLAAQQAALMAAGASVIYKEAYTGTSIERPRLKELLDTLNEGDTVVVTKLDRLARNCHDGLELIDTISSSVEFYRLRCNQDPEAALVAYAAMAPKKEKTEV